MNKKISILLLVCLFTFCLGYYFIFLSKRGNHLIIESLPWQSELVQQNENGELFYKKDHYGAVIPDFSFAGYCNGNKNIPELPVLRVIDPIPGDNTSLIQSLIDSIGELPADTNGFRGILQLNPGLYEIYGSIYIQYTGIVVRGTGSDDDPTENTILLAKGNSPPQRDLVIMGNKKIISWENIPSELTASITDSIVPVGSCSFSIENGNQFHVGDQIIIHHPCTQEWLEAINFGGVFPPKGDEVDERWAVNSLPVVYNRYITGIEENEVFIDAPVFYSLDRKLSQSFIYKPDMEGTIYHIGLENLQIDIETTSSADEEHAWQAVRIQSAENGWIKNCKMRHFGQSGIISNYASRFTIENCEAIDPIGLNEGERGYNFNTYLYSQLILFKDCYARNGRHHYVSNGTSSTSGIVFLDCISDASYNLTEGHRKWSSGLLFDNYKEINVRPIEGWRKYVYQSRSVIGLYNRENMGTGHGWSAVNSICWNCNVDFNYGKIVVQKPPTAQNYAIGCIAKEISGKYKLNSSYPPGHIEGHNRSNLQPESLYKAQLKARKKTES